MSEDRRIDPVVVVLVGYFIGLIVGMYLSRDRSPVPRVRERVLVVHVKGEGMTPSPERVSPDLEA